MKKAIFLFSFLFVSSLFLSACTNPSPIHKKSQLSIYTTVFPLQYFTEQIGGKYVDVKTIYPPGSDEHTFEPSQQDMMNLADSDLFFYIGLGLEGFVEKAKETLKNQNVTIIPVANSLQLPKSKTEEETGMNINPHVWLDPIYCKEMAGIIKNELIKKMPKNKEVFTANYDKLAKDLDHLNAQYKTTIHQARLKKIMVTHAAFGYWENQYGLKQTSISGLSTTNEPSQKQLEQMVATAKNDGIHYVLFEQNVNSKLGKIVQQEIGAKALYINNLAILTPKNLKDKETYFTLMNKNLQALKIALNQ